MTSPPSSLTNPTVVDADQLKQLAVDYLTAQIPGFENVAGDGTDVLLETVAQMMSYGLRQYADPTTAIVSYVGGVVYGAAPYPAQSASSTVTFVTDGTAGTIPAGTNLGVRDSDGVLVGLQTTDAVTVAVSVTSTPGVAVIVSEPGAAGNDLTGDVQIVDRLAFAISAGLDADTSGGVDAESPDSYSQRIAELVELIAPRPILPADFAAVARLLVPSVYRAMAIDNYNADTAESDVERCVTVAVMDSDGENCSSGVKADVLAAIEERREDTFLAFVIDPTRTAVAVVFTGVAEQGYDAASVETAAEQAVVDLLAPVSHGVSAQGRGVEWEDRPIVRFQDVVTALNNVPGFDHYTALTLNGGTADVVLAGPAGVPDATVSGTVTAP